MDLDDLMALAGSIVAIGRVLDRMLDAFSDAWKARKLEPSVQELRTKRGYTADLAVQQHSLDILSEDLRAIETSVRMIERWVESQQRRPAAMSIPPEAPPEPVEGAQDLT